MDAKEAKQLSEAIKRNIKLENATREQALKGKRKAVQSLSSAQLYCPDESEIVKTLADRGFDVETGYDATCSGRYVTIKW